MLAIAILAAGKGTRMKSALPKVLHELAGISLVKRVLHSCRQLNPDRCFLIVGHQAKEIEQHLEGIPDIDFVLQEPQNGTGHAVQQLIPLLNNFEGDLLILNGDVPLLKAKTVQDLIDKHKTSKASATFLSAKQSKPKGYGRVFADRDGKVNKIIEERDCSTEELENTLTNAGIYCFNWLVLRDVLPELSPKNEQSELYLTDAISKVPMAVHLETKNTEEVNGINDKSQLAECECIIQKRLRNEWMSKGVTFINPETSSLSEDCNFGIDVIIEPQTHLRGKCYIGDNCKLGPNALIDNSKLGDNVKVIYSVLNQCEVDSYSEIGPFSHLRPEAKISNGCRVGNFVEVKNSAVGEGSKVNHLSYIGDSILGRNVNIGAGTITANFDGYKKSKTVIGDFSKTGANSVLVAPILIGKEVTIGAGSTLTKNVPDSSLAIERSKQLIKENWAKSEGST